MLSRYDNKKVRITTTDGSTFTGVAEACPSGYGLSEFDRQEESLQVGDAQIFLSDIAKIEDLSLPAETEIPRDRFDSLIEDLLERPYYIVDILPEQVPAETGGQYFAVDRYFREPDRLAALYRRFAEVLLKLNCYCGMTVSFDNCEYWEKNPEPEEFARRLEGLSGNTFLRAMFEEQGAMAEVEPGDTCMCFIDPQEKLLDKMRKLAASEGLFVWGPKED